MKRNVFTLLLLLGLAALTAFAADVTGQWTAQVQGRGGMQDYTFTFKVDGAKLTGTVTNMMGENPISDGKVEGDNISFAQKLDFNGNAFTITYKGKVGANTIEFTREIEGRGNPTSFTAKKK